MSARWQPVTLEHELAEVGYPTKGPSCAFDGRPGDWPDCCDVHRRPCCPECRAGEGFGRHVDGESA